MDNPRPDKVAVVDEVRERLGSADAAILTEYRGLTVSELATLRQVLATSGAKYKIYKNTLVKLAIAGGPHAALEQWLEGPTAIAFVSGEVTEVAKALRDFSRVSPALVVKGGISLDGTLGVSDLAALADLPSRQVLLSILAGAIAAPLRQLAGLMQALPRNLAYGLKALVELNGGEIETRGDAVSGDTAGDADTADTAETAGDADTADTAETADTADTADTAGDAGAEAEASLEHTDGADSETVSPETPSSGDE